MRARGPLPIHLARLAPFSSNAQNLTRRKPDVVVLCLSSKEISQSEEGMTQTLLRRTEENDVDQSDSLPETSFALRRGIMIDDGLLGGTG